MKTSTVRHLCVALLAVAGTLSAPAASRTWTNAAGDGDWFNTANWSDGTLPTASDTTTVEISEDTTLYVTNDVKVKCFCTRGTGTLTVEPGADGAGSIFADLAAGYRIHVFSNAVSAVYNVPVKLRGTSEPYFSFCGALTFQKSLTLVGGVSENRGWSFAHLKSGATLTLLGDLAAEGECVYLPAGAGEGVTYRFYGKVTAKKFGHNNSSGQGYYICSTNNPIGTLLAERYGVGYLSVNNALSASTLLAVGQYEKGGKLLFDGTTEQVADRLTAVTTSDACTSDSYCVSSSGACTLTLKGSASAKTTTGLAGAVSLVWDPADAFTQSFTNRQLKTTGSITVKGGAVALTGTSSAPNLSGITVASGASMKFLTSTASPLTAGKTALKIVTGGTVEAAEGVTVQFADVMLDGAHQVLGTYVALDSESTEEGVRKVGWVTGKGKVVVDSGTKWYWTGVTGSWSDGSSWTAGTAPTSDATAIILDAETDGDRTLTVDDARAVSVPLTIQNGGAGRSVLAVASGLTINVASAYDIIAKVNAGGCIRVPTGGRLTVDGKGKGIESNYRCFLIDGGELAVAGGTVAFTNMPSNVDVCGTETVTGRVTMTSGEITFTGNHWGVTDDSARIRFRDCSHANFTGGAYRFLMTTSCQRYFGDGGRVDVKDAVIATANGSGSPSLTIGSGESTYSGAAQVNMTSYSTVNLCPTASDEVRVTLEDEAKIAVNASYLVLNGGSYGSHLLWNSSAAQTIGVGLRVGWASGTGEMDFRRGYLAVGYGGLQVGGSVDSSPRAVSTAIAGSLAVSGGAIRVQGRDRPGNGPYYMGLSVGDGTFTTLAGTDRPICGTLDLSGGEITNTDSHVMVGGGFATGAWRQTGGKLVDKNDLWIGAAGGAGTYAMGGGTATVSGRLYVGGMHTNRSSQVMDMCKNGIWPFERHDAEGTLTVTGGAMTVSGDAYVGVDGDGTVEMVGTAGSLTVGSLILSNVVAGAGTATERETSSHVRFTLGADGVSPVRATRLVIAPGAKLTVDWTAYAGSQASVKLFDTASSKVTGSFDSADVTSVGAPAAMKVVVKSNGVYARLRQGFALILK